MEVVAQISWHGPLSPPPKPTHHGNLARRNGPSYAYRNGPIHSGPFLRINDLVLHKDHDETDDHTSYRLWRNDCPGGGRPQLIANYAAFSCAGGTSGPGASSASYREKSASSTSSSLALASIPNAFATAPSSMECAFFTGSGVSSGF
jgi:hypothetical protein